MNHYDDLQRFQEKTRTQNLKFQDLSSQAATREHGDWAILNQLNPDAGKPASLALGGSVSAPLLRISSSVSTLWSPRQHHLRLRQSPQLLPRSHCRSQNLQCRNLSLRRRR